MTKEQIVFWLERFRHLDMTVKEHRQRLIDVLVNVVYVYDDYFLIVFNYKDDADTATRLEVEASLGSDLIRCGAPSKSGS